MRFFYDDIEINYQFNDNNSDELIIFLHGWGDGSKLLYPLDFALKKFSNYSSLYIDFPPFGASQTPKKPWTIYNYASMAYEIISKVQKENSFKKTTIVGHSFGGRVAIILCAKYFNGNNLVLLDAAGVLPKRTLKYRFKILKFKFLKKYFPNKALKMGSADYLKLDETMKKTFKNIVNEDLTYMLEMIEAKTLIIFGAKDKDTPIYMAKILHKNIKNSTLYIIKNAGHFVYIDFPNIVAQKIYNFIT